MELSRHLKPQPRDSPSSHSSSVMHGGAELWNSGSGTMVCAAPSVLCFASACAHVAPCDGRASGGTWMWHIQAAPAACG